MNAPVDLLILGSGSTAFAAALTAQELGKTAVMIEQRTVGGTCVNRGCLPSKNLIEAAKLVHEARHPRYPGLHPCAMTLDFATLIAQKDAIIDDYRSKKYESLVGGQFRIEMGSVRFLDAHTVEVDGKQLSGEKILIATGSRPTIPDIAGLAEVPYLTSDLLTSDEPRELKELPQSLLIVGGGYIALELGQMFHRFGTHVTLLERSAELLAHGYEPEVGHTLKQLLVEEGLHVITNAAITQVRRDHDGVRATVRMHDKIQEFRSEQLLLATGRRPHTDTIAIERAGVWDREWRFYREFGPTHRLWYCSGRAPGAVYCPSGQHRGPDTRRAPDEDHVCACAEVVKRSGTLGRGGHGRMSQVCPGRSG